MRQLFPFTLTVLTFMSCASQRVIPQPSKITLEDALASVGRSFQQFRAAEGDLRVGLIPAEVAVTFNISATATDSQKIYVDLNPTVVPIKAGGEAGSTVTNTRGNQISIKFQNLFITPKDTLLTMKTPDEIDKLFEMMKKNGVIFFKPKE